MKIRVISDLHLDVNEHFPFSLRGDAKDVFTLVAGDTAGNVKLTTRWIKQNIHKGMFIVGNHDPCYNDSGLTINKQKQFLHSKFKPEDDVTFLDESVGIMAKMIPDTNILVIGSTLYTDYQYMSEEDRKYLALRNKHCKTDGEEPLTVESVNMNSCIRRLNDFRWGHVDDEFDDDRKKQRLVSPRDYKEWFKKTFGEIKRLVEENPDKDIIIVTHHCPTPKCISPNYVHSNLNASYVSDLEDFIVKHPNIRAWCCGHVHTVTIDKVGECNIICNPRGYEQDFDAMKWNPNTYIDTDTWKVVTEEYKPTPKLEKARKDAHDRFMKYAPFFI